MKRLIKIVNTLLLAFVFIFLLVLYIQKGPLAVVNISLPSIVVSLVLFVLSFVEIASAAKKLYRIRGAPGGLFMKLVGRFYSRKTIEEVFEPTQRDFLDEYADAISDYLLAERLGDQLSAAGWVFKIYCKYYFAFFRAVLRQNFVTIFFRRMYQVLATSGQ